jgi:hypothetical protein
MWSAGAADILLLSAATSPRIRLVTTVATARSMVATARMLIFRMSVSPERVGAWLPVTRRLGAGAGADCEVHHTRLQFGKTIFGRLPRGRCCRISKYKAIKQKRAAAGAALSFRFFAKVIPPRRRRPPAVEGCPWLRGPRRWSGRPPSSTGAPCRARPCRGVSPSPCRLP